MADNVNLRDEMRKLIKLQGIDSEIFDLNYKKDAFPARKKELDDALTLKTASLNEAEKALRAVQVLKDARENELESAEEKLKKHEGELAKIKTNKEYKAMLEQMEQVKADISLLEEKVIFLLDDIERAKNKHNEEKRLFEEEKRKSDAEKQKIAAEEKEVGAKIAELDQKRKVLIEQGIDKVLLKKYEKILENRGKYALAKINGEFCGGCNMTLRPQIINEAKLLKDIVMCESCSRILYDEV